MFRDLYREHVRELSKPEVIDGRIAGPLVLAVHNAARSATWLGEADLAALEAVVALADLIDTHGPYIAPEDAAAIIARMLRGLDQLGLAPAGRSRIDTETEDDADAVAELRAIAGGRRTS